VSTRHVPPAHHFVDVNREVNIDRHHAICSYRCHHLPSAPSQRIFYVTARHVYHGQRHADTTLLSPHHAKHAQHEHRRHTTRHARKPYDEHYRSTVTNIHICRHESICYHHDAMNGLAHATTSSEDAATPRLYDDAPIYCRYQKRR